MHVQAHTHMHRGWLCLCTGGRQPAIAVPREERFLTPLQAELKGKWVLMSCSLFPISPLCEALPSPKIKKYPGRGGWFLSHKGLNTPSANRQLNSGMLRREKVMWGGAGVGGCAKAPHGAWSPSVVLLHPHRRAHPVGSRNGAREGARAGGGFCSDV